MNNTSFSRGEGLYKAGDYSGALRKFSECLKDTSSPLEPGEYGKIYHRIGNCLMKQKDLPSAIKAYDQARTDLDYDGGGSLHNNLGKAYSSLKQYDEAIENFKLAIDDPAYKAKYKAYMGLGNIDLKKGESAEAGKCFREAALDERNPDPASALLNLGVCFMSLGRPEDAITSYASAKDFSMSTATKNKLNASMGQAYAANNQPKEAVECFKAAVGDGTFNLSDSAAVDYSRCVSELSRGVVSAGVEATSAALAESQGDLSGLDVSTSDEVSQSGDDPYFYDEGTSNLENVQGYVGAYENDDQFFTASEEEMKDIYKQMAKKDRRRRGVGLKIVIVLIVIIILGICGAIFGYTRGYGYPTQRAVAAQLFSNPTKSNPVFAKNLSDSSKTSMLAGVVQDDDIVVSGIERSMSESSAYVTAHTEQGGEIKYKVNYVRDLVGWKISNIDIYFTSANS